MKREGIIYLDHAATSWPKPQGVAEAVAAAITEYGANPGRGAHRLAVEASRVIVQTRYALAQFFKIKNPNDIVFTNNTSAALNTVIFGYLNQGDHVIYGGVEHNSVRRPIEHLVATGSVTADVIQTSEIGEIDLVDLEEKLKAHQTKLVIINHGSNLLGTIAPIATIAKLVHRYGARLLVDAAQTAGTVPLHVEELAIDFLAFPGHKGLLGPQGIAGVYIHPEINIRPLLYGGTGSQSEHVQQPNVRPDRYETGTLNTPGIAGLRVGLAYVQQQTVEAIHKKEWALTQLLISKLQPYKKVRLLGPDLGVDRVGVVSFTIDGVDSARVAFELDRQFGIAVRSGYHCTPMAHEVAGTRESGAVRVSVGWSTTEHEIEALCEALQQWIGE
jgi:cysteine desulfurase family protein